MALIGKADLMPWAARVISSGQLKQARRKVFRLKSSLRGDPNTLKVFVNPRDPFSILLLQALPELQQRFRINFEFHTVWDLPGDMFPEVAMWSSWAIADARELARLYGLEGAGDLDQPEAEVLRACCENLLDAEKDGTFLDKALTTLVPLWQKEAPAVAPVQRDSGVEATQRLETNEQLMRKLGHYQGGMVWFQGEWFWGLDRLDHLEQLLIDTGLANSDTETPAFTRTWAGLASSARKLRADNPAREQPLEIFFSIRSPYSHLGLERAVLLAGAWNIPLVIRPVLPMLMRGQPVPDSKKWYIFHDTRREADKLGIRYGFVADPLGAGVERCYALFDYARSEGREVEYTLNYARAVNAEGIRSETDSGLKTIVERSGLDWEHARTLLGNEDWRGWAEENRKVMYGLGLWGVPGFRYGDTSCWGQDRLWRIEEAIQKKGGI